MIHSFHGDYRVQSKKVTLAYILCQAQVVLELIAQHTARVVC